MSTSAAVLAVPSQSFEIRPLAAPLGAEVLGIDVGRPLSSAEFDRIHQAFLQHGLLIFRDQHLTPAQQIAFSRLWGELLIHVLKQFQLPGHPEVFVISNIVEQGKPIGLADAGKFWHSDLSYVAPPSLGAILYAQELPEEGGDTLFASQQQAYDALPESLRRRIEGLRAVHSYTSRYAEEVFSGVVRPTLSEAQRESVREVVHPVVRTHPETGRKGLFVNANFTTHIVDLPAHESRQLLDELFARSIHPQFIYRHRWQPNDLLFWDNRALIHLATGCPSHLRRRLHRTTIAGEAAF
ncbi:MAG: TauD/TfdA family dioxygenase [Azoarcus sp.]|nr:TauD/TfdA family dioxygenase [Azoarcus sp.]